MEWAAFIISMLTFGFAFWVYYTHDKEIKTLEKEQLRREALQYKQAQFAVKFGWLFVNNILNVQNVGKVTAKNIALNIESKMPLTFPDGTTQYRIKQLEATEKAEPIPLRGGYVSSIKLILTWDDESGQGVTKTLFVENDVVGNEFQTK